MVLLVGECDNKLRYQLLPSTLRPCDLQKIEIISSGETSEKTFFQMFKMINKRCNDRDVNVIQNKFRKKLQNDVDGLDFDNIFTQYFGEKYSSAKDKIIKIMREFPKNILSYDENTENIGPNGRDLFHHEFELYDANNSAIFKIDIESHDPDEWSDDDVD
jgi:hypothetical protein